MISEATIAAVRDRTDLVALVAESVKLKRAGRAWTGLCPFHSEKTPSFSVNPERGYWRCFGCDANGSAIDFVMQSEGKTFPEAVRDLAERAGIEIEDTATDAERREANAARKSREDLYAVNALAATFYERAIQSHPQAHHASAEVERRGLSGATETLTAFRIGYAPAGWDALTAYLQRQGISPITAERVGLLMPRPQGGGYYDRFRHRLMFAVLDVSGRVVAFSGRALAGGDEEKPAKYINSPESPIYTKGEHLFGLYQARTAVRQSGSAVLAEGNFDVVALQARGVRNAVAPLGTAFTDHQARLLKRYAPSVTVMFDGDAAGRKATWSARGPCRVAGLAARAVDMPEGADPDDLSRREPERMASLVASAPAMTQWMLDRVLRNGEVEGVAVHDQAARARAAQQIIAEGSDDAERAVLRSYAGQLSAALGVDIGLTTRSVVAVAPKARGTISEEMSLAMLGALLDFPALLDVAEVRDRFNLLDGPAVLATLVLPSVVTPAAEMVARLPEALQAFAAKRLARPVYESQDEALRAFCSFAKTIARNRSRFAKTQDAA